MAGAYDAAENVTTKVFSLVTTAGANTVQTQKFIAHAALQLKAVQATAITAGTSATSGHCAIFKVISGTATTALTTVSLGTSAANATTNATMPSTASMIAGDQLTITNGTDATGVIGLAVTYNSTP